MSDLKDKRLFLLDMDGTIYLDETLFPAVPEFLQYIRSVGGRYMFLTNNSSRGIDGYLAKMKRLGIPAVPDDFLTSVDAAIFTLKREFPGKKCYVLGTESFLRQLTEAGIPVTVTPDDDVDILLVGFDTELNYQKLIDASKLLLRGVIFLATNPDWVCPTAVGWEPDCGSICEMLGHVNGRKPRFIGKPEPEMVKLALAETGRRPEEALIIGDRVYTDIACGVNAGIDSLFVLSGEGVISDIEKYNVVPSYIRPDIEALYRELTEAN